MTRFSTSVESTAVVKAPQKDIWAALTDPDLLPKLTPFLRNVKADGDLWTWELQKIPVLGVDLVPVFTERMTFDEPSRIDYAHEEPKGADERAGVNGWYQLREVSGGTELKIRLEVEVQLPLAKAFGPAVRGVMKGVIATMGQRFSANLLKHLHVQK
jgi:carbon monoxide dehydrogenase subunit G